MKTFDDLEFKSHPVGMGGQQATMDFPNGYGVSVLVGDLFYSNGVDTYEVAVMKGKNLCYDTTITGDVEGHLTADEVTELMKKVQELESVEAANA